MSTTPRDQTTESSQKIKGSISGPTQAEKDQKKKAAKMKYTTSLVVPPASSDFLLKNRPKPSLRNPFTSGDDVKKAAKKHLIGGKTRKRHKKKRKGKRKTRRKSKRKTKRKVKKRKRKTKSRRKGGMHKWKPQNTDFLGEGLLGSEAMKVIKMTPDQRKKYYSDKYQEKKKNITKKNLALAKREEIKNFPIQKRFKSKIKKMTKPKYDYGLEKKIEQMKKKALTGEYAKNVPSIQLRDKMIKTGKYGSVGESYLKNKTPLGGGKKRRKKKSRKRRRNTKQRPPVRPTQG